MNYPDWADCKNVSWCKHNVPTITPEEMDRLRNSAAVRVRARRRIYLALGVRIQGETELAGLLRAAQELEVS